MGVGVGRASGMSLEDCWVGVGVGKGLSHASLESLACLDSGAAGQCFVFTYSTSRVVHVRILYRISSSTHREWMCRVMSLVVSPGL